MRDGQPAVTVCEAIIERLVDHAIASAPDECCGLLLGTRDAILDARPAANIAQARARHYRIDPHDHFAAIHDARGRGIQVVGAYHSHPAGTADPSATDATEACSDFLFVIIGLAGPCPQVAAWRWVHGNFTPIRLVRTRVGEPE